MIDLLRGIRSLAWIALIGAIYQELRKPAPERTWHGRVAGIIPYDFRVPTIEKLKAAYWDPSSDTVFTDRVFGVGWAVNIPVFIRKLNETATQYAEASRGVREEIERRMPQARSRGNGRPPED
jgi:hypothetical protein